MSMYLIARVFHTPLTSCTDKLVLLAMAEHAWDDGTRCYPSVARLSSFTALSRRAVQMALRRLEAAGWIIRQDDESEHVSTTAYRVVVNKLSEPRAGGGASRAPESLESKEPGSKDSKESHTLSGKPDVGPLNGSVPKKSASPARALLDFLNHKTGRNFQPLDINLKLIGARLREGATEEQCRAVIARKVREWTGHEHMEPYLRPATLFNRTKFASYLGELPSTAFPKKAEMVDADW